MAGMTNELNQTYKCKFCEREFARENTLSVHVCEQKKRFQDKDSPASRIGLTNFKRFYEMTQGSAKNKTFDDFATSAYYKAFIKFGHYCVNARVVNAERFADWLLKNNKRIDYWGTDKLYEEFLRYWVYKEPPTEAMTRALQTGVDWGYETGNPTDDFLRYGNSNKICYLITTGRVTGWTIFNCDSGHEFLEGLNEEQLQMVYEFIDPERWNKKLKDHPGDTEYIKEMLKQAGW